MRERRHQLEILKKRIEEDEAREKRLKLPDPAYFFKKFLDTIEERLQEKLDNIGIPPSETEDEAIDRYNFLIRSLVIKGANKAFEDGIKHLKEKYKREVFYSKENIFPRKWMTDDRIISTIIDNSPVFIRLINYLYNRNRYSSTFNIKGMVEQADKLTGGRRYFEKETEEKKKKKQKKRRKEGHIYSSFYTDKNFYDEATRATGISKNSIQRYLFAFAEIGIIEILYDGKTRGKLYADGYFAEYNNKLTKHSFIKNTSYIKQGLRNLPRYIRDYGKQKKD